MIKIESVPEHIVKNLSGSFSGDLERLFGLVMRYV